MTPSPPPRVGDWQKDGMAALSLAGLLIPEAVAYAGIAGLPPQAGLVALCFGLLGYGLIGQSRFAIVASTSSTAAVLASATASIAPGNPQQQMMLAAGLVLLTGVLFAGAAFLELGRIADFIARPVLRGFSLGLGLVVTIKQLPHLVGLGKTPGVPLETLMDVGTRFPQWHLPSLLLGLAALALLFGLSRWRRLPAALLVMGLGILAARLFPQAIPDVALVGRITLNVARPDIPDLDLAQWERLGELALAVMLMSYAESCTSIRSTALRHGDTVDPNRDLWALGMANILSGLFQGAPVGAGYSATSANETFGATSRAAGMLSLAVVLIAITTLLPLLAFTPEPVLAAIVIHALAHNLNPRPILDYFRLRRGRTLAVSAALGALLFGVLDGLLLAVGISFVRTIMDLSKASVSRLGRLNHGHDYVSISQFPEAREEPGILILRADQPLYFANSDRTASLIRQESDASDARIVIISLEESPDLDASVVESLAELAAHLAGKGKTVYLARLKPEAHQVLSRAALKDLGEAALIDLSVDGAVHLARRHAIPADSASG
ncbi:SulP family inorganic anion transporter [Paludibacterium paludis]|nr:SulP family inorganic anion transporter [Paludibacterium paludis]